ncbi:hypothetical protein [Neisseria yangbaofengii]|nr:hypothetical protein [Neisseria yangbaofengii]
MPYKAHVYNHCVWLNAQCYGEPYEEMRRETQNALGDAPVGAQQLK